MDLEEQKKLVERARRHDVLGSFDRKTPGGAIDASDIERALDLARQLEEAAADGRLLADKCEELSNLLDVMEMLVL